MVLRRRAAILRPHASSGRWVPEDRHTVLRYLAWRDGGRCGLCAMPLPARQGQIEHVIPKKFGYFDFSKGRASPGTALESRLHHVDNLQTAHDCCNRAKGDNAAAVNWRHPGLPPVPPDARAPHGLPGGGEILRAGTTGRDVGVTSVTPTGGSRTAPRRGQQSPLTWAFGGIYQTDPGGRLNPHPFG